ETYAGYDWFCASMANPADHSEVWVDLGCMDATDATGEWQEVLYTLDSTEVVDVVGKSVDLVFELWSDVDFYGDGVAGSGATTGWVDYVRAYATGGSAGGSIDPNEPNDDYSKATLINCGDTISGTIGDALGGYDMDWFELNSVPTGQIDIDIDADTQIPPSALDSVVYLYYEDDLDNWVAWSDDDGVSFDSYITYTNGTPNATFYVSVESYSGDGSPDSFYDLTVQCAGSGSGPPPAGGEQTPPDNTWTVMLYFNAEDPNFEPILTQYREDIEAFIGGKSAFLNVVILYDGPSGSADSGTTRYLVQPNGSYTPGTNKWDMGELNVGHPDTLANFVSWAMDQYPAEYYYLAIDDHGDGAYGISVDPTSSNDQLTPPELYSALKSATHNGSRKIDIFDYEACLMGLAENAYDLREWVDYVVFFEQISWGINTYPVYFSDLAATDTALDVGRRIIDRYYAGASAAGYPHTISLIDTSQMEAVGIAVTNFGNMIRATDTLDQKNAVNDARDNSQAFAADIDATNPVRAEYIDLWDLADEASGLAATQAAAVKSAVDAAVVHERHASGGVSGYVWDHSGVHGLSIYYPSTKSSSAFSGYGSLYQMSQGGGWDEFLEWVLPAGMGRGMGAHRAEIRLTGGDTFIFRYVYLPVVLR
ncbi:MAG: clostripain-related cysteine peptidase, partial [Anaerolineae bacterium]